MNKKNTSLSKALISRFPGKEITVAFGEVTLKVSDSNVVDVMTALRDEAEFKFEQLTDLCVVDYLHYGQPEWETDTASNTGFSRASSEHSSGRLRFGDDLPELKLEHPRYAVIYHLLSYKHNQRLRVKLFVADDNTPMVPSISHLWSSADWNEREAFDLFGVLFEGHPDLRRILTDYGFIGHPFRKDFPLVGNVEMRYDPQLKRVIYEPVSIEPRVLVPKVIRNQQAKPDMEDEADNNA